MSISTTFRWSASETGVKTLLSAIGKKPGLSVTILTVAIFVAGANQEALRHSTAWSGTFPMLTETAQNCSWGRAIRGRAIFERQIPFIELVLVSSWQELTIEVPY